jgi:hypothetical protein
MGATSRWPDAARDDSIRFARSFHSTPIANGGSISAGEIFSSSRTPGQRISDAILEAGPPEVELLDVGLGIRSCKTQPGAAGPA